MAARKIVDKMSVVILAVAIDLKIIKLFARKDVNIKIVADIFATLF
jgi:hypothetical protein